MTFPALTKTVEMHEGTFQLLRGYWVSEVWKSKDTFIGRTYYFFSNKDNILFLDSVYVVEAERNKGYAIQMVEHVKQYARVQKFRLMAQPGSQVGLEHMLKMGFTKDIEYNWEHFKENVQIG